MNPMIPQNALQGESLSRRWFLRDCGVGLGAVAATSLLEQQAAQAAV